MGWVQRTNRSDPGAITAEYVAIVLVVAGLLGALFAARTHERVGEAARIAICQVFDGGSCDAVASGGSDDAAEETDGPGTPDDPGNTGTVASSGGAGPGAPLLQMSPITDGPLAVTPVGSQLDPNDLDPDEDASDDQGWLTDPGYYARQNAEIQGHEFRVRGYLNPRCLRAPFPCTSQSGNSFRAEYTAQAHAIRALSNLNGRRSFYERWVKQDPIDDNVHWEVSPENAAWRIDILVHDEDMDSIIEVKRYRGPQTTVDVDAQLARYQQNMASLGVEVTRNNELNMMGWAVTYTQPPSLGDRFRLRPGRQWFAWADPLNPGHVYFAPEEDTPDRVKANADNVDPDFKDKLEEFPIPIPIPVPIRPPVPLL